MDLNLVPSFKNYKLYIYDIIIFTENKFTTENIITKWGNGDTGLWKNVHNLGKKQFGGFTAWFKASSFTHYRE